MGCSYYEGGVGLLTKHSHYHAANTDIVLLSFGVKLSIVGHFLNFPSFCFTGFSLCKSRHGDLMSAWQLSHGK